MKLPRVQRDSASAAFFDAAARGELLMQRGPSGTVLPPEARTDPGTGSPVLEPHLVSGHGTLISWSVVHHSPSAQLAEASPYITALIELTEGPWLFVRLAALAQALRAGLPVEVFFVESGEALPVFRVRPQAHLMFEPPPGEVPAQRT